MPAQSPRNFIPSAVFERAATELNTLLTGTAASPDAPRSASAFLNEVEELYAGRNEAPQSPRASQAWAGGRASTVEATTVEELKEVLRALRALDSLASQSAWRAVTIDPLMPMNVMYGAGLVFNLLMHLPGVSAPTMVCVGGRLDRLATQYKQLHAPQGLEEVAAGASAEPLCAVSAELAMDKLAAALVSQGLTAQAANLSRQRGKSQTTLALPWWRQAANCWPSVLLGPAEDGRDEWQLLQISYEALQVAGGLWKVGASCQLWPPGAGGIDARVVSEAQKSFAQYGLQGFAGLAPPDFIVTIMENKETVEEPQTQSDCNEKQKQKPGESNKKKPKNGDEDGTKKAQKSEIRFRFQLRAISDQGHEVMDRPAKETGRKAFEDRAKLLDFLERLAQRHVTRS